MSQQVVKVELSNNKKTITKEIRYTGSLEAFMSKKYSGWDWVIISGGDHRRERTRWE